MTPPPDSRKAALEDNKEACPYQDECYCVKPAHREDHEFVRGAMRVLSKLEDIKWSTLKAIIIFLALLLLGTLGLGIISKIKGALGA